MLSNYDHCHIKFVLQNVLKKFMNKCKLKFLFHYVQKTLKTVCLIKTETVTHLIDWS